MRFAKLSWTQLVKYVLNLISLLYAGRGTKGRGNAIFLLFFENTRTSIKNYITPNGLQNSTNYSIIKEEGIYWDGGGIEQLDYEERSGILAVTYCVS